MKARDIALLAVAILFPVGVFWFVLSPKAIAWVIGGLMALPPGMLNTMVTVGIGVAVSLSILGFTRKPKQTEEDAEPDSFGRY